MKEKIHYVYKITNLKNNKEYIGVRSHPTPEEDTYMGSSKILHNLYRLEGEENFTKKILKTFSSREEAENYEDLLLTEEYCNRSDTYNITNTVNLRSSKRGFRKDIWFDYYDQIRERYIKGETTVQLGNYYNCDQGTIRTIIQDIKRTNSESQKIRHNKFLTSGNRNLELDKYVKNIKKMYTKDMKSLTYIAKQYGVDQGTIRRRLISEGIPIRDHMKSQQLRNDDRKRSKAWKFKKEIVSLYNKGVNRSTLSKLYRCDFNTIDKIVNNKK